MRFHKSGAGVPKHRHGGMHEEDDPSFIAGWLDMMTPRTVAEVKQRVAAAKAKTKKPRKGA